MTFRMGQLLLAAALGMASGCAGNTGANGAATTTPAATEVADTTYMPTGFYYLAEGKDGVKMRKDRTEEIYTLSPVPFASVAHIIDAKLVQTTSSNGVYNELCMTFDSVGKQDLAEGTGNPLHPQIAAVVANRLLFVVKNEVSIKTGIMYVGLVNFSETEMEEIRKTVLAKK